jgi:ABC-type phosphate transport system substrate-binding protein
MKRVIILLVPVLLLSFMSIPSAKTTGFKVIVNPDTDVTSLTKKQVSRLFLKKVKTWSNDLKVVPVDLPSTADVRGIFSKEIHGKSVSAVKAYWQQRVFSGRAVPPPEKESDASVIAFVRNNPGAIGYVSENANLRGVTVIAVK